MGSHKSYKDALTDAQTSKPKGVGVWDTAVKRGMTRKRKSQEEHSGSYTKLSHDDPEE